MAKSRLAPIDELVSANGLRLAAFHETPPQADGATLVNALENEPALIGRPSSGQSCELIGDQHLGRPASIGGERRQHVRRIHPILAGHCHPFAVRCPDMPPRVKRRVREASGRTLCHVDRPHIPARVVVSSNDGDGMAVGRERWL